jgi:WD40 repeat protein
VGGANAELKVLDIASRKQVGAALRSYGWYYTSAIFSPDGKYIATADNAGQLGLWNAANHHRVAANIAKGSNQLGQIAFSPNSELLAAAVNDDVRIWNARSFKNPMVLDAGKGGAAGLSFSPDGKILATASTGGIIKFWNTSNGRLADAPLTATNDGVSEIADSPNGSILADAENDGTIQLWNPSTRSQVGSFPAGAPKDYEASSVVITALVFNLAGTLLATAGADGTARF